MDNLVPLQISKRTGKIQEWIQDYKEIELGHRHFSHLYGLYPGHQISPVKTPELAKAAALVLEARLKGNPNAAIEEANNKFPSWGSYINDEGGGNWQRVWLTTMWARLYNADRAFDSHKKQINSVLEPNLLGDNCVQLDGSFGLTAAVSEMLLQSHEGYISILPALPKEWANGSVSGLRSRGGYTVDIKWQNGKLANMKLISDSNNKCKLHLNGVVHVSKIISEGKDVGFKVNNQEIEFATSTRSSYEIMVESN